MNLGIIKQYKGLPPRIYVLFTARTIAAMGSFVYSFLTLFMSDKLGYSDQLISRYLLLVAVLTVPAALIGGKIADHFSRKWTYVSLMVIGELFFLTSGFLINKPYVLIFIITGVFFVNAASPVIAAMMMDYTTPENRQVSMSLVYLGFNLGFAFGPSVAGFLFVNYTRWIFWGNAIINLIAIVIIMIMIKDETPVQDTIEDISSAPATPPAKNLLRQLWRDPLLVIVAALGMSFSFSYSQVGYMLPLDMTDFFGVEAGSQAYGIVFSLNGLMVFLLTPIGVYILKKYPPIHNLGIAGLLFGLGFGGFALTHNLIFMYFLVMVWTSGEVCSATNTGVFIASHAPEEFRARYQSIYDIIQGTGRAVGPMLMGFFLINHTVAQGWILCGILCLISSASYFTLYKTGHR